MCVFLWKKTCFGLNMHVICNHIYRFLDINIPHPASTSAYLDFGSSPIYELLETSGFLWDDLTIFGDNDYVNTTYTTAPFEALLSRTKDAYNFYHSQIIINIECAFGILINRWAVLRTPIPINISIKNYINGTSFKLSS